MTRVQHKNRWQRTTDNSEVFAKYGRQRQSCHQLCPLQIQVIPLQLFIPTIRLGFILAFISSRAIMKHFFPHNAVWKGKSDQDMVNRDFDLKFMSCWVPAALLSIVSQWHNRGQEMEVNKTLKAHLSITQSDKGKMSHKKDFPTATI